MGRSHHAAILIIGLLLAGCGHAAAPSVTPPSSTMDKRFQAPTGMPLQPSTPLTGTPTVQGAALLKMMRTAFAGCNGFEADVRSYSQGHYKNGEHVDELR